MSNPFCVIKFNEAGNGSITHTFAQRFICIMTSSLFGWRDNVMVSTADMRRNFSEVARFGGKLDIQNVEETLMS